MLEDEAAVDEHHYAALDLACQLLEEIRDDGWPGGGLGFADPAALHRAVLSRPPRRADPPRGHALGRTAPPGPAAGEQAWRAGHDGARRTSQDGVRIIGEYGARHADVADVAAYARALGGTLRLIIDLDGTEAHRPVSVRPDD